MPEESPLEVTKEVVDSKTDLKGVKHGSLSERIRIDLEQLKDQVENNPLHNTVVTKMELLFMIILKITSTI